MKARRLPVLLSVAVAACVAAGLALVVPPSTRSGPPSASAVPVRVSVVENVLMAAPAGRVVQTWAERGSDERHSSGLPYVTLVAGVVLALAVAAFARRHVVRTPHFLAVELVHTRGPPNLQLA